VLFRKLNMPDKSTFPWKSLNLALSLAGIIAISLVLAALFGRWLDSRFGTAPWAFLGMTLFAFIMSNTYVVIKSLKIMAEIEKSANGGSASGGEGKEKEKHADRGTNHT
jgi:F0F1-type ATP synthase assembly protein I